MYEYLLHVGAQKSAQTFLSEVSHPAPTRALHPMTAGTSWDGSFSGPGD